MSQNDELVFLPLGGCGEIGMNLNLFGYGPEGQHKWIMADLGVTFGDERTPGIDLIMPDPTFIEERRKDLLGIVLTHGHEDHIGAVPQLWSRLRCPVYATPFTAELVKAKLAEVGLLDEVPLHIVELGGSITLGPFEIELVTLTHSILEPNALAIRTPLGNLLHTGDWKIDPHPLIGDKTDEECLRKLGNEGVLAMLCDSTNVFSPGVSGSEADVRQNLVDVISTLKNKVAVTSFASNVARLESVMYAAEKNDRHVCLVGRSMHRITQAARKVGYLKDARNLVDEDEAGYLPPDKVLYLCTGSQGEGRAALWRIADEAHQSVSLSEGDAVIFSSRVIPGNEIGIFELQNRLAERGIEIITEADHFVHVSGHPCRDELATMYSWVKPKISIPVHGEMRHLLEHARLAKSLQIPEAHVAPNGTMLRLAPGPAEVIDRVHSGRLYLDGDLLVPSHDPALSVRRKLSNVGHVVVTVVLDKRGELIADAAVKLAGVPLETMTRSANFVEDIATAAEEAVERLSSKRVKDDVAVDEVIRRAVRIPIREVWGKRPLLDIQILRAD